MYQFRLVASRLGWRLMPLDEDEDYAEKAWAVLCELYWGSPQERPRVPAGPPFNGESTEQEAARHVLGVAAGLNMPIGLLVGSDGRLVLNIGERVEQPRRRGGRNGRSN